MALRPFSSSKYSLFHLYWLVIGYDCGVYALWYAEAICQEQFHGEQLAMSVKAVTAEQITQFRAKLKQLIQQLAK